jgi:hypothetical protein
MLARPLQPGKPVLCGDNFKAFDREDLRDIFSETRIILDE